MLAPPHNQSDQRTQEQKIEPGRREARPKTCVSQNKVLGASACPANWLMPEILYMHFLNKRYSMSAFGQSTESPGIPLCLATFA
jgi:hypothetical protein